MAVMMKIAISPRMYIAVTEIGRVMGREGRVARGSKRTLRFVRVVSVVVVGAELVKDFSKCSS
jgi:predicted RNA-binding protein YlqC (UPF0109 family)